jgi:hypothetical protein
MLCYALNFPSHTPFLRKYEKNKQLLSSVRQRTVLNKKLIVQHNNQLQDLKAKLENLRKTLISPLVRRNDSVSIDNVSVIEQQIKGLDSAYDYLSYRRTAQKSKFMEIVYGSGKPRVQNYPEVDGSPSPSPNDHRY